MLPAVTPVSWLDFDLRVSNGCSNPEFDEVSGEITKSIFKAGPRPVQLIFGACLLMYCTACLGRGACTCTLVPRHCIINGQFDNGTY